MYDFTKLTAVTPDNMKVFETYKFYLDNFEDYHRTPELSKAMIDFSKLSSISLEIVYFLNEFRFKYFDLIGGTATTVSKAEARTGKDTVLLKVATDLEYPDRATEFDKAALYNLMKNGTGVIKVYTADDVQTFSKFIYMNRKKFDEIKDKRFLALIKFIQQAAKQKATLVGWRQPYKINAPTAY